MNDAALPTRTLQRVHAWRVVRIVVALGLAALLILFDWNWFKGPVERRVSQALGRPFRIQGDLHVDLGSIVIVESHGLSLANAGWSKSPDMAHADMLRLEIREERLEVEKAEAEKGK